MTEEEFFIVQSDGSFPDGAWYFELKYPEDTEVSEATARRKITLFQMAVFSYIDNPLRRVRSRVLTRTRKSSCDGKVHYTHYIICTRCRERDRNMITLGWGQYTGGEARSELLPTRHAVERRARTIAKYYLPD